MSFSFRLLFLAFLAFLSIMGSALAATSNDYYQAGLSLYNAKNYSQALQYFSAAIQVDPGNATALQARANCYYTQGNYSDALADYQKVLAQNPNNVQLSQFVQALQAKVGSSPASGPPPVPGVGVGDPFAQGVALYGQKQYQAAIPLFRQAARLNPADGKPSYYQGICEVMTGDNRDGALDLSLSNRKQPSPSLEAYVNQLMARLSPEDQQWVNGQLTASQSLAAGSKGGGVAKNFGIRLEPEMLIPSLGDFNTDAKTELAIQTNLQAGDPSRTFTASVPQMCGQFGVEPFIKAMPQLEIGLPIAYMPLGSYTVSIKDNSGLDEEGSLGLSAFSIGLQGRYLIGEGDLVPFVAGGFQVVPVSLDYNQTDNSTYKDTGSFSSMALGFQIQVGADYQVGDGMCLSAFAGYLAASAGPFSGTVQGSSLGSGGTSQSASGKLDVVKDPPYGNSIVFVPDKYTSDYQVDHPLAVDLSGPFFGLQFLARF